MQLYKVILIQVSNACVIGTQTYSISFRRTIIIYKLFAYLAFIAICAHYQGCCYLKRLSILNKRNGYFPIRFFYVLYARPLKNVCILLVQFIEQEIIKNKTWSSKARRLFARLTVGVVRYM